MTPRVTLGMPVRNVGQSLPSTIESVLAQDFGDFELIISDNASEDDTPDICRTYAKLDSRIAFQKQRENIGAAPNFNLVFQQASSEYFQWIAGDDLLDPRWLARCVNVLDTDHDAVLCYSDVTRFSEHGHYRLYRDPLLADSEDPITRFRQVVRTLDGCYAVFGVMRAEALRRTGLIGSDIGSDRVLLAELSLQGTFQRIPEPLFFSRIHTAPASGLRIRGVRTRHRTWWDPRNDRRLMLVSLRQAVNHLVPLWRYEAPLPAKSRASLEVIWQYLLRDPRGPLVDLLVAARQLASGHRL